MKSKYAVFSEAQLDKRIRAAALEEMKKYKDEVYDKVTDDVFKQAVAVALTALELMGWREKRLKGFLGYFEAACDLMRLGTPGGEYGTRDAIQHLTEDYGVDFSRFEGVAE